MRFSFLGGLGNRALPGWLTRALRYSSVAVLPALVAPAVLRPTETWGQTDPALLLAAGATLAVGLIARNMIAAIIAGALALYGVPWLV